MKPLTPRQAVFVSAILADRRGNATRAPKAAGYAWPDKQGSRLLTMPAVRAAMLPELSRRKARLEVFYAELKAKAEAARKRRAEWIHGRQLHVGK